MDEEGIFEMVSSTYSVKGMTCGHCASSVSAEVSKLGGVRDVAVDVASGTVTITSDSDLPSAAVTEAVEEAGYEVVPA